MRRLRESGLRPLEGDGSDAGGGGAARVRIEWWNLLLHVGHLLFEVELDEFVEPRGVVAWWFHRLLHGYIHGPSPVPPIYLCG